MADASPDPFKWIISKKYDLTFFIGSVLVSFVFLGLYFALSEFSSLSNTTIVLIIQGIFYFGLDQPHIFQTASRVYTDQDQFHRVRNFATWGFLAIAIAVMTLTFLNLNEYFYFAFEIIGVFHIVRQNVGFIKAYRRINGENDIFDLRVDLWSYYIIMFGCLFKDADRASWPNTKSQIMPESASTVLLWIMIFTVAFYLFWQVKKYWRKANLNWPKLALMGTTATTHILIFWIIKIPALSTVMDTAYHDIQYHGWMAQYQKRKYPHVKRIVQKWLLASLMFGLTSMILFKWHWAGTLYIQNLLLAIVLFHYFIDGFIWQFGKDPKLTELMFSKPVLTRS